MIKYVQYGHNINMFNYAVNNTHARIGYILHENEQNCQVDRTKIFRAWFMIFAILIYGEVTFQPITSHSHWAQGSVVMTMMKTYGERQNLTPRYP